MSYHKKCSASSSLKCPPAKKRNITKSTVDKWIADKDKALSTSTWLKYDVDTATFIDYIAQEQRQGLALSLSRARFFGLQADGHWKHRKRSLFSRLLHICQLKEGIDLSELGLCFFLVLCPSLSR